MNGEVLGTYVFAGGIEMFGGQFNGIQTKPYQ